MTFCLKKKDALFIGPFLYGISKRGSGAQSTFPVIETHLISAIGNISNNRNNFPSAEISINRNVIISITRNNSQKTFLLRERYFY